MVSRKYLNDYRVEETVDANGRARKVAVYVGGDYTLAPPVPQKDRRLIVCLCLLVILVFIGALMPVTQAARRIYVALPFVFSALTVFMMAGASYSLLRSKEIMKRYDAERVASRLPPCSVVTAVLSGAAFIGLIIASALSWDSVVWGDFVFGALLLVNAAASAVIFAKCHRIKAVGP